MGVKFANRMRQPLIAPTMIAPANISRVSGHDRHGRPVVVDEERCNHDQQTRERADRQIDAGQQQWNGLSKRDKAERRRQHQDVGNVERGKKIRIVIEGEEREKNGRDRQWNDRRVVGLQEVVPVGSSRAGLRSRSASFGVRGVLGAHRRRHDTGFHHVIAGQRLDDPPARQNNDLVAQPFELRRIGGIDHDGRAGNRDLAQEAVDFGAGADIDSLGRLVGHDQPGFSEQRARHDDLLLIAARERPNRRLKARSLDCERFESPRDVGNLAIAADDPEGSEFSERRHGRVFANGQAAGQTFDKPIGGHERCFAQEIVVGEGAPAKAHPSFGRLKARERAHKFRLTVPCDPRDAKDLPRPHVEADVSELPPGKGLHGEVDIPRGVLGFGRKGRSERASDDHAQQGFVGHL